jgi:hypothetical protein
MASRVFVITHDFRLRVGGVEVPGVSRDIWPSRHGGATSVGGGAPAVASSGFRKSGRTQRSKYPSPLKFLPMVLLDWSGFRTCKVLEKWSDRICDKGLL